ncbi:P-loop containing nucleoside triphosphate hydrolase protein [Dentipellis sp. KUC8613]|nr:P-loop containing nucleoside triphosphate hydrolase protein [Dentipellis sp. KUC8613]
MPPSSSESLDPLALAVAPPPDETPEEQAQREQDEKEARRQSEMIDEQIRAERNAAKKKKPPVKVLMLGQSQSGKSTTIKNFQITHANSAWVEQRIAWRAVIHLNMVSMINIICRIMGKEMGQQNAGVPDPSQVEEQIPEEEQAAEDDDEGTPSSAQGLPGGSDEPTPEPESASKAISLDFSDTHHELKSALSPLIQVQEDLETWLGQSCSRSELQGPATPFMDEEAKDLATRRRNPTRPREFFVRSASSWKAAILAMGSSHETQEQKLERMVEMVKIIVGCKKHMIQLWADTVVQDMLSNRKIRMDEQPGFFLNDINRIAVEDYEPTDDDVVRARLRTMGVQTYKLVIEHGQERGREWIMYDVGGVRSRRAAWYPYFTDVNAIIFMAPISVFDEQLEEDHRVNRLEDSYILWKAVCSSKLLSKVQLILFLNKCDVLHSKLQRGIKVRRFVPTFGDRENNVPTVAKYFRSQFRDILRRWSPEPRSFYSFLTSVTFRIPSLPRSRSTQSGRASCAIKFKMPSSFEFALPVCCRRPRCETATESQRIYGKGQVSYNFLFAFSSTLRPVDNSYV